METEKGEEKMKGVVADAVVAMFHNAPGIDAARFRADIDALADATAEPRA